MNNFPGALIKFYSEHLDNKGISKFNGGTKAFKKFKKHFSN